MSINVETKITGNKLVITVDLEQRHGKSGSGKSVTIASTQGNEKLSGKHAGISFGLNVYEKVNGGGGEPTE